MLLIYLFSASNDDFRSEICHEKFLKLLFQVAVKPFIDKVKLRKRDSVRRTALVYLVALLIIKPICIIE